MTRGLRAQAQAVSDIVGCDVVGNWVEMKPNGEITTILHKFHGSCGLWSHGIVQPCCEHSCLLALSRWEESRHGKLG